MGVKKKKKGGSSFSVLEVSIGSVMVFGKLDRHLVFGKIGL